ncbi:YeiH family protein [Phenylobacterium immobile]|uniref:YeiH family protein n=1 Tax=Phenylobacterium immobile TaxID=21 RepID=UPI000A6C2181|nr:putative sulfate exporter family transporter [Phenylobacterium immobile]
MANELKPDRELAHRLFQSLGSMEGFAEPEAAPPTRTWGPGATLKAIYPGALVAIAVALSAQWVSQHYGAPVMLFALLFGMTFNFLHEDGRCVAGIEFTSKVVLRIGVALLGARITLEQIAGLGAGPILIVIAAVATTILLGVGLGRALKLSPTFGILSGGAVAICGASAALAIAAVLPRHPDSERDTVLTVVAVTTLSTIAMITYPLLTVLLGLDHASAGVFLGGTIHDVAQVVGAGYTISPETGDVATYVKLLRVTLLLPVVFLIAFVAMRRSRAAEPKAKASVPLFLIGFAALVALGSFGMISRPISDTASAVSRWCLVAAIAALGMKTSFKTLMTVGWKPLAMLVAETAWIAGLMLAYVALRH